MRPTFERYDNIFFWNYRRAYTRTLNWEVEEHWFIGIGIDSYYWFDFYKWDYLQDYHRYVTIFGLTLGYGYKLRESKI